MPATKVLIVEDETPIREMIAFHLARAGYDTLEAADSRRARELLADERPDLALVDWMLPDMSGLELTRMLRRDQDNESLAIIMLTARADENDKVSGLESGADDYLTKPFSPRSLWRESRRSCAGRAWPARPHSRPSCWNSTRPGIELLPQAANCSSALRNTGCCIS